MVGGIHSVLQTHFLVFFLFFFLINDAFRLFSIGLHKSKSSYKLAMTLLERFINTRSYQHIEL